MSLFGAKKTSTFQKAAERARKMEETPSGPISTSESVSSGIGALLDEITGPLTDEGTAALNKRSDLKQMERDLHGDSEYERLRDEEKKEEFEAGLRYARVEHDLRRAEGSRATSRVEMGQLPSDLNDMRAYSDLTGKTGVTGIT